MHHLLRRNERVGKGVEGLGREEERWDTNIPWKEEI